MARRLQSQIGNRKSAIRRPAHVFLPLPPSPAPLKPYKVRHWAVTLGFDFAFSTPARVINQLLDVERRLNRLGNLNAGQLRSLVKDLDSIANRHSAMPKIGQGVKNQRPCEWRGLASQIGRDAANLERGPS